MAQTAGESSQPTAGMHMGDIPLRADSPEMFDRISSRYDLLNHLLSFGQDLLWRRKLARMMSSVPHGVVLDIACGTCDQILSAYRHNPDIDVGLGIDMAGKMLRVGSDKVVARRLSDRILLARGDGMDLPLADDSIDFAMISFGIRNMTDAGRSLTEFRRILKPGGTLSILEFSLPENRLIRTIYLGYFRHVLPRVGAIISGDSQAYSYLNKTVEAFYDGEEFCAMMRAAGFNSVGMMPLTLGTVTIYVGKKDDL